MDVRVYSAPLRIPAQTPITDPVRQFVQMEPGRVIRMTILFPWGHAGLTGLQIWKEGAQIAPLPDGAWLIGNDVVYDFPFNIFLDTDPPGLMLVGYNEDEYFDHTIYVSFHLMPKAALISALDALAMLGIGRM
jgi:hypothetical protein